MVQQGDVLAGKYEVVKLVGTGGMSDVYLLTDRRLNKQWAGKKIRHTGDARQDAVLRRSFETEFELMRSLDHPALPRITDILDESGDLYVIMDYIEGVTLADAIGRAGAQDQTDVIEWGMQLCDVLDYLHTRTPAIIYRDMKPANVMLTPDGQLKLIDFGIARHLRDAEAAAKMPEVSDTDLLGTRGYAAPEQYGGAGQTDARTDVYCLGATLYHLVTGRSPAEPPYEMLPIRQVYPHLSGGLEAVLAKATAANPAERYQSCAEMLYALEHYEDADEAHARSQKTKLYAFRGAWVAALACLLIGCGALAARQAAQAADYGHHVDLAQASNDAAFAQGHYLDAVEVNPADGRAYLGLIETYRQDGLFSASEEAQLLAPLLSHLDELESSPLDFAEVSFNLGNAYWYAYRPGADPADGSMAGIRASRIWFANAAGVPEFADARRAALYEGIASFATDIVPLIEQGSDAGMYAPYIDELQGLMDIAEQEGNEVVRLNAAELADSALGAYARKFRADGIARADLEGLRIRAIGLVDATATTSTITDARKAALSISLASAATSITDAFID